MDCAQCTERIALYPCQRTGWHIPFLQKTPVMQHQRPAEWHCTRDTQMPLFLSIDCCVNPLKMSRWQCLAQNLRFNYVVHFGWCLRRPVIHIEKKLAKYVFLRDCGELWLICQSAFTTSSIRKQSGMFLSKMWHCLTTSKMCASNAVRGQRKCWFSMMA